MRQAIRRHKLLSIMLSTLTLVVALTRACSAQAFAGVYDFGMGRQGEKRGDWTPNEWLGVCLLVTIVGIGLALTLGLCYFLSRRQRQVTYGSQYFI